MTRRSPITGAERPPGFVYPRRRRAFSGEARACSFSAMTSHNQTRGTLRNSSLCLFGSMITERLTRLIEPSATCTHDLYSVKENSNLVSCACWPREGPGRRGLGESWSGFWWPSAGRRRSCFLGCGENARRNDRGSEGRILLFNVESESELWTLAEVLPVADERPVAFARESRRGGDTHPYISDWASETQVWSAPREAAPCTRRHRPCATSK